ncbi:hypothetical protein [Streptomyces sp. 7N604]|uniref:hypothetical protein n=1 Tax=Streptomyces sp. 7N604 TaxID=3457415 RepID=UPI003FD115BC
MARSLMDAVTVDFRLEKQHDAYRHALEQVLAARLEGLSPRTLRKPCGSKAAGSWT